MSVCVCVCVCVHTHTLMRVLTVADSPPHEKVELVQSPKSEGPPRAAARLRRNIDEKKMLRMRFAGSSAKCILVERERWSRQKQKPEQKPEQKPKQLSLGKKPQQKPNQSPNQRPKQRLAEKSEGPHRGLGG